MEFKKMYNGNVVVVHKVNKQTGIVYGWNLNSPNLRIKPYKPNLFEKEWRWNMDYNSISSALHMPEFYLLHESGKYNKSEITQKRHEEIVDCLVNW